MRSVADALRDEGRRRLAALTPDERIDLAFRLGDADLAALRQARGLTFDQARMRFATSRRHGRQPSCCHDG